MQFSTADIQALQAAMGEPCTLTGPEYILNVSGIPDQSFDPGSPFDGAQGQEQYSITCAAADVVGVDSDWTATVRDITRPVLQPVPDGSGFVKLILGDQIEEVATIWRYLFDDGSYLLFDDGSTIGGCNW